MCVCSSVGFNAFGTYTFSYYFFCLCLVWYGLTSAYFVTLIEEVVISVCHLFKAEIKEMLSIVLRDLCFSSAVVHQVRNFLLIVLDLDFG